MRTISIRIEFDSLVEDGSYETEVDEFDNEELYTQGAYFILRAIMKMHGTEI